MENISSAFTDYAVRFGLLDNKIANQIRKDLLSNRNINIEDEIKRVFYKYFSLFLPKVCKKGLHSYCERIYECFVEEDDFNISKIFRRVFIINQYQKRLQLTKFFNKWKDRVHTLNDNTNLNSSLNKFYNPTYNNVTSISKRSNFSSRNKIPNKTREINKKKCSFSSITHESDKEKLVNNSSIRFNTRDTLSPSKNNSSNKEKTPKIKALKHVKSDVFQKLYEENEIRTINTLRLKEKKELNEMEGCTFYPKLINKSFSNCEKPYYDKLHENQKEKEKKRKILSEEIEEKINKDCTFIPKINKTFNSNDKIKGNFLDRVKIYEEASRDKFKKLEEEYTNILKESQRKESLSKRSLSKCPSYSILEKRGDINNLYKKQKEFLEEKKKKLQKIEETIIQEKGITFKPQLNNEKIKEINTSLLERNAEFIEKKSIKIKSAVTQQELECTFAPKINQGIFYSEDKDYISAGQRLFEYSKRYSENREKIKEIYKEEFSFKPQINSNTQSILKNRDDYLEQLKKKFDNKFKWKSSVKKEEHYNNNPSIKETSEPDYSNNIKEEENIKKSHDLPLNHTPSKKEMLKSEKLNEQTSMINNISKENLKYNESPLKIERQNLNFPKQENKHSIMKNSFKNPFFLEKLTDNQLLELANNYITTDESLELFNKIGKFKNNNKDSSRGEEIKEIVVVQKNKENAVTKKKSIKKNFTFSDKNDKDLPKNIKDALNHYKIAENI